MANPFLGNTKLRELEDVQAPTPANDQILAFEASTQLWKPKTFAGGASNTDALTEGTTNLYHTQSRVRATALTGYSVGANSALVASDTLLGALGKLQAQISAGGSGGGIPYFDSAYGGVGNGANDNVTALTNAIANSRDRIRVAAGNYRLNSNISLGDRILEISQGASFSGPGFITPGWQSFTNSERFGQSLRNSSTTAYDIYGSIFPNVSYYDVFQAVARLAPSSALGSHIAAIAGYIQVDAAASGIGNNAVALFGGGRVSVDNGIGWGLNTLLQDNNTRSIHFGTGRYLLGAELDFNCMGAATQLVGVSVGGNSLVQPGTSNAFIVNTLGQSINAAWGGAYVSLDGCASIGLALGASAISGTNINSQPAFFSYFNSGGSKASIIMRALGSGALEVSGGNFSIVGGNLLLGLSNGIAIGGNVVLAARQTGWTAPTGTPNRGAWNADATIPASGTWSSDMFATQSLILTLSRRVLALELALRYHGIIGS